MGLKDHRNEPSVIHLTNEINLPEGRIKSEPVSIQLHQEPSPVNVSFTMPEAPVTNVHVDPSIIPAPVVNMTLPESNIVVNVEQPDAPTINLTVPESQIMVEVAAPDVTVTPEIKVQLGTRQTITEIERDANGLITKTSQIESDV